MTTVTQRQLTSRQLLFGRTANSYVQFLRYGVVSAAALLADIGGLVLLKQLGGLNYLLAATLSFGLGLAVNYGLSIIWVFQRTAEQSRRREFAIFSIIGLTGLGLNDLIIWGLTAGVGVYYLGSKLIAAVIVYFWNFGLRKRFVFRAAA